MSEFINATVSRKCHKCGVDVIDALPISQSVSVAVIMYDAASDQPFTPSKLYLECMNCHNKGGE